MTELTALIQELVRIDSVNPALDPAHPGEAEIARFVAAWAQARGLEVRWLEPVGGRPSVIVTASGSGGGPTLMLNAHLDTVGVTGMAGPFEPAIREGRMFGRGVMDMKASLAVCLLALAWAKDRQLSGSVVLAAVADEEHGSIGTEAALRELRPDAAIVTEPTDLELQVAHRGFSVFEVEFQGKASHTSQPAEGVNALTHMGRLLAAVESHDGELRRRSPHPLLAHGSLQAVLARGGHELFTTPSAAALTVERRTLPGEGGACARAELDALLAGLRRDDPTVQASVRSLVEREPFETTDGSKIEALLADAISGVRGRDPQRLGAPYWTDAALVAAAGVPTILFGPTGGDIHQPTEWLDLESTGAMLRVLRLVIDRFCA
jgi:acetylornithine deacetylase